MMVLTLLFSDGNSLDELNETGINVGEVLLLFDEGKMVFGLGLTWSGWRGLICSSWACASIAAASKSFTDGWLSRAVCRSQMYWITFWMTSSFESLRFFGINGTKSLSLLMYIWTSAFSPSRWRETRPFAIDGTEAPVEQTAVMAFIFFWWILVLLIVVLNMKKLIRFNPRKRSDSLWKFVFMTFFCRKYFFCCQNVLIFFLYAQSINFLNSFFFFFNFCVFQTTC